MSLPHYIVLAWVTMDGVELTGRYLDRLCQVRETKAAPVGKALVWLSGPEVTPAEIRRAEEYAASNQYQCMTFRENEEDPLGKARAIVLAKFANNELEAV